MVVCVPDWLAVFPAEAIASVAVILGDDSLLTKYLNPHMVGVVSSSCAGEYGEAQDTVCVSLSRCNQCSDLHARCVVRNARVVV